MGRLIINNAMTVSAAVQTPPPDEWLVLDADSNNISLQQFLLADANDVPLRRRAAGLPASTRPAGRCIQLGSGGRRETEMLPPTRPAPPRGRCQPGRSDHWGGPP
jgi:hypothetical protein